MPNKGFLGPSSQPAKLTRILRHCRASIPHHECIYKQIFINFLLQCENSALSDASVFTKRKLSGHFHKELGAFEATQRLNGRLCLRLDHLRARADAVQADERVFVLVHVRGLAKLVRVAQNVEHIVTDLERKAKVLRVGLRGLKLLRSSVRSHDADLAGRLNERAGLAALDVIDPLFRQLLLLGLHIEHLSADHAELARLL